MENLLNLENISNPELLEKITNWNEIKDCVKIEFERRVDGKMYIYLKPILNDLSLGSRLSVVRQFRELTQDDVAEYLGLEGENKRRTITRYETNERIPNIERLKDLRRLFNVNINSIKPYNFKSLEDNVYILLWMEELYPDSFKFFEIFEHHNTNENLIMMRFSDKWKEMREKRRNREITWDEYIEWKLNYQIKEE